MLYDKRWEPKTETESQTQPEFQFQPWQEILSQAADELEATGWVQGRFERFSCGWCIGHCALGAIRHVCRGSRTSERYQAEAELAHALNLPIVSWNDHPFRTKEEVVAKLREVATTNVSI